MKADEKKLNSGVKTQKDKKPNEELGFYFSSAIKIYDPNTKKVLVQKRCS